MIGRPKRKPSIPPNPGARKPGDIENLVGMFQLLLTRAGAVVAVDAPEHRKRVITVSWSKGQ